MSSESGHALYTFRWNRPNGYISILLEHFLGNSIRTDKYGKDNQRFFVCVFDQLLRVRNSKKFWCVLRTASTKFSDIQCSIGYMDSDV